MNSLQVLQPPKTITLIALRLEISLNLLNVNLDLNKVRQFTNVFLFLTATKRKTASNNTKLLVLTTEVFFFLIELLFLSK